MAAPVFAVWKNLAVLATIYAEALATEGVMRVAVQTGLRMIFGVLMAIWLWLLLPLERAPGWTSAAVILLVVGLLLLLRQKLVFLHRKVEVELEEVRSAAEERPRRKQQELLAPYREWNIHAHEVVLPDRAECAGSSLSDLRLRSQFGCAVAGVERHGYSIPNPPPDLLLYPGDKLLMLATPEQMPAVRKFISRTRPADETTQLIDDIEMERVTVPPASVAAGNMLVELDITAVTGVQFVGIERDGNRLLNPGPFQGIEAGDRLLALATPPQLSALTRWLNTPAQTTAPPSDGREE